MNSEATPGLTGSEYVLATAAYNEERYIGATIKSVVNQTILPAMWVIVSDGSTDATDAIIESYAEKYPFIRLERITEAHARNWSAQVNAINRGFAKIRSLDFDFIGNLDADITLPATYFEELLRKFATDPSLGVAGGSIWESQNNEFCSRASNNTRSVPHAIQLFRRECFEVVCPYKPLPHGGPDWFAEIVARMNNWKVESFKELKAFHHRSTGTAGGFKGLLRYWYRQGYMDYSFGTHPLFEVAKLARRLHAKPFVVGASLRLLGFTVAHCRRLPRLLPSEACEFLRREQLGRLKRKTTRRESIKSFT